jgi:hypothetical protein
LVSSILENLGLSEEMHNPVSNFLLHVESSNGESCALVNFASPVLLATVFFYAGFHFYAVYSIRNVVHLN